jgi:hypothetical protein
VNTFPFVPVLANPQSPRSLRPSMGDGTARDSTSDDERPILGNSRSGREHFASITPLYRFAERVDSKTVAIDEHRWMRIPRLAFSRR